MLKRDHNRRAIKATQYNLSEHEYTYIQCMWMQKNIFKNCAQCKSGELVGVRISWCIHIIYYVYVTFSTECCRELKNYNTMFHILRSVWNIHFPLHSILLPPNFYVHVSTARSTISHVFPLQWSEPWFSTEAEVYMGESSSQAQENNGRQYTHILYVCMCMYMTAVRPASIILGNIWQFQELEWKNRRLVECIPNYMY